MNKVWKWKNVLVDTFTGVRHLVISINIIILFDSVTGPIREDEDFKIRDVRN